MKQIELLKDFAITIKDALISDRDTVIAVGGMTGEAAQLPHKTLNT